MDSAENLSLSHRLQGQVGQRIYIWDPTGWGEGREGYTQGRGMGRIEQGGEKKIKQGRGEEEAKAKLVHSDLPISISSTILASSQPVTPAPSPAFSSRRLSHLVHQTDPHQAVPAQLYIHIPTPSGLLPSLTILLSESVSLRTLVTDRRVTASLRHLKACLHSFPQQCLQGMTCSMIPPRETWAKVDWQRHRKTWAAA